MVLDSCCKTVCQEGHKAVCYLQETSDAAYKAPDPPPLPKSQVQESPPFTTTREDLLELCMLREMAKRTKFISVFLLVLRRGQYI